MKSENLERRYKYNTAYEYFNLAYRKWFLVNWNLYESENNDANDDNKNCK